MQEGVQSKAAVSAQFSQISGFFKNFPYQFSSLLNYAGSHFEKPKICQGHNNNRYQCQAVELEDVLSLRNQLYESTERNVLSNQLRKWITLIPPKKHTTNENSKTAKLMTMFYKIPTKQDKELPICREMFLASTGRFIF